MIFLPAENHIYLAAVFLLSFAASIAVMPALIYSAKRYDFLDIPNTRSSHTSHTLQVPRIGGVVFFLATACTLLAARNQFEPSCLVAICLGALLLFFTGLYDDLKSVKPFVKMLAQLVALLGLVYFYHDAIERFRLHSMFAFISPAIFQVLVFGFFFVVILRYKNFLAMIFRSFLWRCLVCRLSIYCV